MSAEAAEEKIVGQLKQSLVVGGGWEITFKQMGGVNKTQFSISKAKWYHIIIKSIKPVMQVIQTY